MITINSQPSGLKAAYKPIRYEVTSNNQQIVNIIADIFIDGAYYKTKEGICDTSGKAIFDISIYVQGYIAARLKENDYDLPEMGIATAAIAQPSMHVTVQVRFFEEWSNGTTLESNWQENGTGIADAVSGNIDALAATFQLDDDVTEQDYIARIDHTAKFLTKKPDNQVLYIGEEEYLYFFFDPSPTPFATPASATFIIHKFNKAGAFVDFLMVNIPLEKGIYCVPIGILNLNAKQPNFINSTIGKIRIEGFITDTTQSDNTILESRTYFIKNSNRCHAQRFHFYNDLGGFDSISIAQPVKRVQAVEKNSYKPFFQTLFSGSVETQHVNTVTTFETTETNLSIAEAKWLEQLTASVKVYVDLNGKRYGAYILPKEHEVIGEDELAGELNIRYTLFDQIKQRQ